MNKILSCLKYSALSTAIIIAAVSMAEAETWKIALQEPLDSPEGQGHKLFAKKVEEYSNGELKVEFYPSEQLGKPDAILEQLQAGIVQVWVSSMNNLQKFVPDINFVVAPYLFENREHWERFMQSDLVDGWLKQVEEQAGIIVLKPLTAFIRGPYRVTVSQKPIRSLEDVQGLKLRMSTHKMQIDAWDYLGADIIVLGWSEVYDGLRRGTVEATNSAMALVEAMKFSEVSKYVVRTDDYPVAVNYNVNAETYKNLSPKLRDAVDRAFADAAAHAGQIMQQVASETVEDIKTKGIEYTEIDTSEFAKRMAQFYHELDEAGKLPDGFLDTVEATR